MNEKILINHSFYETRVAALDDGITHELHYERANQKGLVSNIYLGKVLRVLPSMQSAFIDIGQEKSAFINISDLLESRFERYHLSNKKTPIEKILFPGQTLLVEVFKDGTGTKGPRVSNEINLAGRYLVYTPHNQHIGVSQRMEDVSTREMLRERITQLKDPSEKGGFIVRTNAEQATDEEILYDMRYLKRLWAYIQNKALHQPVPSLVHTELDLPHRVLRDLVSLNTQSIEVDNQSVCESMQKWANDFMPEIKDKIHFYSGNIPIFERYGIHKDIQSALSRRVDLPSGGYLIFDQTEAFTAIDVNTGGHVKSKDYHDVMFKTNIEAVTAIAQQLRIRNLGGIIIVDFIDMTSEKEKTMVLERLNQALKKDRNKTTVSDFSRLGLVEITRKRSRESLERLLCEPCPCCQARGSILTARSICYDIMREIQREALQFHPKEFRIIASQPVIDLLLDEESEHLALVSEEIGKPITLSVESSYSPDQFDIVLM
ncbi:Rne/Rng family ribonuclease [Basilea psittacipulmonis]|uniref:Ribonuclease G n=1 Tax=Basilea psittacipulmonis DSM 24701 TaxID=1072685 RepID=A0A077DGW1_9BURK|nr:Rne/Rng family ribonuclease [Basilea psittacipulmonis]AIL32418.1 ribonuclease [Basilea psittacipulmonis DSM 24701]